MSNLKKIIAFLRPILLRSILLFLEREISKATKMNVTVSKTPVKRDRESRPVEDVIVNHETLRLMFSHKHIGQDILDELKGLMEKYSFVSVADLHDVLDMPTTFKHTQRGWTNLSTLELQEASGDWWGLTFPPTVPID